MIFYLARMVTRCLTNHCRATTPTAAQVHYLPIVRVLLSWPLIRFCFFASRLPLFVTAYCLACPITLARVRGVSAR